MAGPRQPTALVIANGRKHLTKDEIRQGCFFQSVIMFSIAILLSKNYEMRTEVRLMVYVVLVIETWISTPIQSACRITYSKEQRMKFKAKALTVLLIISWIEKFLPATYQNQVGFAFLLQSVEIIISCIQVKRKEEVSDEERSKRKAQ